MKKTERRKELSQHDSQMNRKREKTACSQTSRLETPEELQLSRDLEKFCF
jgi:hypothetical protein